MKAGVTFQSGFFAPVPGEEDETDPGRYGKVLALWLAAELSKEGASVKKVRAEDFGWIVVVARQPFPLWLGCGNVDGEVDQWRLFPVAEPSFRRRIFHRLETTTALETLWKQVTKLVPQIPGVRNVSWE